MGWSWFPKLHLKILELFHHQTFIALKRTCIKLLLIEFQNLALYYWVIMLQGNAVAHWFMSLHFNQKLGMDLSLWYDKELRPRPDIP